MSTNINLPLKLLDYLNEARASLSPLTDPDQPLQLDSLGLVRLVAFMESDLNIRIEDDELLAENFTTPRALADLIKPKLETAKGPDRAHDESTERTEHSS